MALSLFPVVLVACLAALAGWRMGLQKQVAAHASASGSDDGMPRLLVLGLAGSVLAILVVLAFPWAAAIPRLLCPGGFDATGQCQASASSESLTGLLVFTAGVCIGATYFVRRGILDPLGSMIPAPPPPELDSPPPLRTKAERSSEPAPAPEPPAAAKPPPEPEPEPTPIPVEHATIGGTRVELDDALRLLAHWLVDETTAVVFSGHASNRSNQQLAQIALALEAPRFVVHGTPGAEVEDIAGEQAGHDAELALALAGSAMQSVLLIDTNVEFNALVLQMMGSIHAACIADVHDEVSNACTLVLPGARREELLQTLADRIAPDDAILEADPEPGPPALDEPDS